MQADDARSRFDDLVLGNGRIIVVRRDDPAAIEIGDFEIVQRVGGFVDAGNFQALCGAGVLPIGKEALVDLASDSFDVILGGSTWRPPAEQPPRRSWNTSLPDSLMAYHLKRLVLRTSSLQPVASSLP